MPKTTPTVPALDEIAQQAIVALVLRSSSPADAIACWVEDTAQAADFIVDMTDGNHHATQHGVAMPAIYGPSITAQAALIGFSVRMIGILTECALRQHRQAGEGAQ